MSKQRRASSLKEHAAPSSSKQRKNNDVITVKAEPMIIGTNDDGEPTPKVVLKVVRRRNLHCQWLTPVTKSMQRLKKKQTLHIPSWVVQDAILNRNEIYLRSAETNRTYNCKIFNPGRLNQRYIGKGWYGYLDDHKPKVGDCLLFSLKYPYNLMIITLMRRKDLSD
ncbi:hypothetical protein P8452_47700 [Trifolium repens]|nr:hypothetical protein P8452_47700 [Trifolium repens]